MGILLNDNSRWSSGWIDQYRKCGSCKARWIDTFHAWTERTILKRMLKRCPFCLRRKARLGNLFNMKDWRNVE